MKGMGKWASLIAALLMASALFCGARQSLADNLPDSGDISGLPVTGAPVSGDEYPAEGGGALDDLMKTLVDMKTFDAQSYGLEGNYEVLEEISGKLEEDGEPDRIRLVGIRRENGVFNRGFLLEVIPSREDPFIIPLPEGLRGFDVSASMKNFMSNKKSEIFLTVGNGKWGDRFLVVAVADRRGEVVLDTSENKIPAVVGRYFNDYRAEIIVQETGERALIDLSPRKNLYDRRLVYNESGTLRSQVNVWVDKFSRFEPVDADFDGILEIKEVMDLNGVGRADRVGYVDATLKYAGGAWNVINSWIAPAEDLNKIPLPVRIN